MHYLPDFPVLAHRGEINLGISHHHDFVCATENAPMSVLGRVNELFNRQPRRPNQASERSFGHLPMVGHRKCGNMAPLHKNHVTAALPDHFPPVSLESLYDL